MKKLLIASTLFALSTGAMANYYVQADATFGQLKAEDAKKSTVAPSISIGKISGNTRYALDYTNYGKIDESANNGVISASANLKAQGVGLSAIYDFKNSSAFTPYVGVRVAANNLKYEGSVRTASSVITSVRQDVSENKWQVGFGGQAGIVYSITDNFKADLVFQYNYLGKIGDEPYSTSVSQYGGKLGVRYDF